MGHWIKIARVRVADPGEVVDRVVATTGAETFLTDSGWVCVTAADIAREPHLVEVVAGIVDRSDAETREGIALDIDELMESGDDLEDKLEALLDAGD